MKGFGAYQREAVEDAQQLIYDSMIELKDEEKLARFNNVKRRVWKEQEARKKNSDRTPRMSPITLSRNLHKMQSLNSKLLVVESTSFTELPVPKRHVESLIGEPRRGQQKNLDDRAYRNHCYNKARFELLHPNFVRAEEAVWKRAQKKVKEQDLRKGSRTAIDFFLEEKRLSYLWLKKAVEKDRKLSQVKCYGPGFRMTDPDGTVRIV